MLTAINMECCVSLIVVSGACQGLALAQIIQPSERAPVFAVLGPGRTVSAGELEDAHLAFYRTLYATRDYTPAVAAINDTIKRGDHPFALFGAESMFREVMRGYFKRYCSEDAITSRLLKVTYREQRMRDGGVAESEIVRRRQWFRMHLTDHRMHFDRFKPHFFAMDLCPENKRRSRYQRIASTCVD